MSDEEQHDVVPDQPGARAIADAERFTLEALLSAYSRDFQVGVFWDRLPACDGALTAMLAAGSRVRRWLRLPFNASGADLLCPLIHASASGRHRFGQPLVLRQRKDGALSVVTTAEEALSLVEREVGAASGGRSFENPRVRARLAESRDNMAMALDEASRRTQPAVQDIRYLASEQSLHVGHRAHPLAKSRWGWSREDVRRYSPEHARGFRLCYALVHPDLVVEDHAQSSFAEHLRAHLHDAADTPEDARAALDRSPSWKLLPVHPWEAERLRERPEIAAAICNKQLVFFEEMGPEFFATASVRTVYSRELPFSLKLSLHVGVTNAERVNYLHEMQKGCAVARLLRTPWGDALRQDCPRLHFLRDDGFVALRWEGDVVEGTGVIFRANEFPSESRLALLAAFFEPGDAENTLLRSVIGTLAASEGITAAVAAERWLDRYLDLLFGSALDAYERHGLALELHAQNVVVGLLPDGSPSDLYFRDNQGYFFRRGRARQIFRHAPEMERETTWVLPEEDLHGPFAYYLLVNNVLGIVEALSSQGLLDEARALPLVRQHLVRRLPDDSTGFVRGVLSARGWPSKASLRMCFDDMDEARRPVDAFATFVDLMNPLTPPGHPTASLMRPPRGTTVYRRPLPDLGVTVDVRALEIDRDMGFIHDWVNRDYARGFWGMAGPLWEQETFYIELHASGNGWSFVGEVQGRPMFVFETYWVPRDASGGAFTARPGDYGFHIIMCPPDTRVRSFSRRAFQVALEYCFRLPEVERIIGEADTRNLTMERLITSVGYVYDRVVTLPDKVAKLTFCTRESFLACCPDSAPFISPSRAEGRKSTSTLRSAP